MDILLFLWILFAGVVPPAIVGLYLVYLQQKMAKKMIQQMKEELRAYAKGELLGDIGDALSNRLNAIFGGISKQGSIEGQQVALQMAKENPGIANLLTSVAGRAGARWLGKKLGLPKDVADQMAGISMRGGGLQSLIPQNKSENIDTDINKYNPYQ